MLWSNPVPVKTDTGQNRYWSKTALVKPVLVKPATGECSKRRLVKAQYPPSNRPIGPYRLLHRVAAISAIAPTRRNIRSCAPLPQHPPSSRPIGRSRPRLIVALWAQHPCSRPVAAPSARRSGPAPAPAPCVGRSRLPATGPRKTLFQFCRGGCHHIVTHLYTNICCIVINIFVSLVAAVAFVLGVGHLAVRVS